MGRYVKIFSNQSELIRGTRDACRLLGISPSYFYKLKSMGVFDGSFVQQGRTCFYNKAKLIDCLNYLND